jgi:hypothetical protein
MFSRALVSDWWNKGIRQPMRAGTGYLANPRVSIIATDANLTLTVDQIKGGAVQFSSFSAGRNVTTPTAALILASVPDMDIGDSFVLTVSCVAAFAATWVAGTGVTLAGRATTPASTNSIVVVTKTGAATVTWNVL